MTWQATPKNKLSVFVDVQDRCSCIDTRALTSPEASANFEFPAKRLVTATYTAPLTSRMLIEAAFAHKPEDWGYFQPKGGDDAAALIGVQDQATGVFYRGPRPHVRDLDAVPRRADGQQVARVGVVHHRRARR